VSLRSRLTLVLLFLATIGLVTAAVISYTSLRTFLEERADNSLDTAVRSLTSTGQGDLFPAQITVIADVLFPGNCFQVRTSGRVVSQKCTPQFQGGPTPPTPRWPASLAIPAAPNASGERVRYFTVGAVNGDDRYRVRASVEPDAPTYEVLVATPFASSDAILHRLFLIEVLVTAIILGVLAAVGLWVVGVGLRPLDAISRTAIEIAGGDLSKRVEVNERTEIGRLARTLNAMLGQIETAFQAREASEAKLRRFVADASHELRTPLAAVRAYAELFSRGAASRPDDLERSMRGVKRESERMSELVDELTLLAHLDEGQPLGRDEVDLESVVAESVETARALDPERPIALATEPAVLTGDRARLRQLVDNLLANARAHTPPATPVTVTLERVGATAVLEVSDSGPGISPEELEHVFERFYRADASRARASGGVGLGLSIVAALAEAHGGSAAASSEPGKGATFTITLPCTPLHHGEPEQGGSAPHDDPIGTTVA
jgi:two-component system OmpR family sensor kinase